MRNPLFIVGCPRSGTSLLSRILDTHSQITIPFESHIYKTFYSWLKYYGSLKEIDNCQRLVEDILETEVMRDWGGSLHSEDILPLIKRPDIHGIFEAIMLRWTLIKGKRRWGEKTPGHLFYWPQLLEGFPNLKAIHIIRDGRDVASSWRQARFGPKHFYALGKSWKRYLMEAEAFQAQLDPSHFLEIRYENLVSQPERVVRQVCEFLGEEFEPKMLNFYQNQFFYPTDKGNQANLGKPLMTQNIGKWRTQMNQRQLGIFEAVAGDYLIRYGYGCASKSLVQLSPRRRIWYQYAEHLPLKLAAMARNTKGMMDGLRRLKIYLRLRLNPS